MGFSWKNLHCLFLCTMCVGTLTATDHKLISKKRSTFDSLPYHIEKGNWSKISGIIEHSKHVSLTRLDEIAKAKNSQPLARAVGAVNAIMKKSTEFYMPKRELVRTALFFETQLPKYAKLNQNYISRKKTKLPFTVEVDPTNNNRFILSDRRIVDDPNKIVTLAILYDEKNPQIVIRETQEESSLTKSEIAREISISKKIGSAPGVVETKSITKKVAYGKNYRSVFHSFYNKGSLQNFFNKKVKLSLIEKIEIARGIITGLNSLHSKGITHRDLGAKNCLINITKNPVTNKRIIRACIGELGSAEYVSKIAGDKVQKNMTYMSPESLLKNKMKGDDYLKADVYTIGCVLYNLFYDKPASWRNFKYMKKGVSLSSKHSKLVNEINESTKSRREFLQNKIEKSFLTFTNDEFECIILRMINPDPLERANALQAKEKIDFVKELYWRYIKIPSLNGVR